MGPPCDRWLKVISDNIVVISGLLLVVLLELVLRRPPLITGLTGAATIQMALLLGITGLAYLGWSAQRENAIRQSIESIEQIELPGYQKIVPTLRDFHLRGTVCPEAVVVIEEYDLGAYSDTSSLPGESYFRQLEQEVKAEIQRFVEEQSVNVEVVTFEEGLQLRFTRIDDVEIRTITAATLRAVWVGEYGGIDAIRGVTDPSKLGGTYEDEAHTDLIGD